MKKVGLRELKNRLSQYVRTVKAGHGILVTDRGQVVAELLPPGTACSHGEGNGGLAALARRAAVTLGAPNSPDLYPAMPSALPQGTAQRLLDQERGDR